MDHVSDVVEPNHSLAPTSEVGSAPQVLHRNSEDNMNRLENPESIEQATSKENSSIPMELTIPGLQQSPDRVCIVCGVSTDLYCSSCAAVSYCSERCQRRDWAYRHKDVCHNLKRLLDFEPNKTPEVPVTPSAAPLRLSNSKLDQDNGTDMAKGDRNQTAARNNNTNNRANNNKSFNDNNNNNKSNRTFTPRKEMRRPQLSGDEKNDARDDAATTQPKSMPPDVAKPEPAKPEPVRPPTIKPEGVNVQAVNLPAVKPAEPARPAQQRLTPLPVKQVKDIKELKPASYIIEKLSMGATFMASLEAAAADCASKQPGFVCLTIHEDFEDAYSKLCQDFAVQCADNTDTVVPAPNLLVAYLSATDGGWYRARCLGAARAALLDAGAVVPLPGAGAACRTVSKEYEVMPEFCAVINGPGLKVGMNLQCTLKAKTANGYKVSVVDPESLADLGEAEVERWMPEVESPAPAPSAVPTVTRPDLLNSSHVVLLDAKTLDRACVRSAAPDATIKFDSILHDVLLFAIKASPLKEPPQRGTVVISKFTDGVQYRALVKRTNVKNNKYLVEYIEYGNEEIVPLEKLYPCPEHLGLASVPTLASLVQLSAGQHAAPAPPALALLERLKDSGAELILTLPSGEKTAPSGSLVQLHSAQTKENITKKLEDMCTPEWKKIEERGGDVLETTSIMFNDFPTVKLPLDRPFVLEVVDFNSIENGYINGFPQGEPLAEIIYGELTDKINEYAASDLCKEPYLPKIEELCITQCPPYPQWFRAALIEQGGGAGGGEARVLYVDYGNVETVPVAALRKMLPEFVAGLPGLASLCHIKGFPAAASGAQLAAALQQLQLNDDGRGTLHVASCCLTENNIYEIDAPQLIAALDNL